MRTSTTIIAIVAAGMIPLAAGPAEAGVSVSIGWGTPGYSASVPVTPVPNNHTVSQLAGQAGSGQYFRIHVPAGQTYLTVLTEGGYGDSDLYLARGYLPTPTNHEFASNEPGTYEEISVVYPASGYWYVLLHGHEGFTGVSLLGSWWQQQVYYAPGYYAPSHPTSARVRISWHSGKGRPSGGLIPYILRRVRGHHRVRHDVWDARRPHGVVRPYVSQPRVIQPRVIQPRRAPTTYLPSRTTVRPGTSWTRPTARPTPQRTMPRPTARPTPQRTMPRPTATPKRTPSRTTVRPGTSWTRPTARPTPQRTMPRPTATPKRTPSRTTIQRPTSSARPTGRATTRRPMPTRTPTARSSTPSRGRASSGTAASAREKLLSGLRDRIRQGRK